MAFISNLGRSHVVLRHFSHIACHVFDLAEYMIKIKEIGWTRDYLIPRSHACTEAHTCCLFCKSLALLN